MDEIDGDIVWLIERGGTTIVADIGLAHDANTLMDGIKVIGGEKAFFGDFELVGQVKIKLVEHGAHFIHLVCEFTEFECHGYKTFLALSNPSQKTAAPCGVILRCKLSGSPERVSRGI